MTERGSAENSYVGVLSNRKSASRCFRCVRHVIGDPVVVFGIKSRGFRDGQE
jgi:hypothetical protein